MAQFALGVNLNMTQFTGKAGRALKYVAVDDDSQPKAPVDVYGKRVLLSLPAPEAVLTQGRCFRVVDQENRVV